MAVFLPVANRGPYNLATTQAGAGASANQIDTRPGYTSLVIQLIAAGGTNVVAFEQSIDNAATWVETDLIANRITVDSAGQATISKTLLNPVGMYRTNRISGTGNLTVNVLVGSRSYY